MKKELKDLLEDSNNILEVYYWSDKFDDWSEHSFNNVDLKEKEQVFKYQMKVYNELGVYIPFGMISYFVYKCVTEFDCVWCSSNISIFGTIDKFQDWLIGILKGENIEKSYENVQKEK